LPLILNVVFKMMNDEMKSREPDADEVAILPGPTLGVQVLSVVEMLLGTAMLFSPVALVFIGFIGATFGRSAFPFILSIALSILLIAGGLALILNGQKRFKGRRQQPGA
jgi:hypothetical protein